MRSRQPIPFLTVLPFAAVLLAQDVKIHTRVEDDGTGLRAIEIAADKKRSKQIEEDVPVLLPDLSGQRLDPNTTGDNYRISGDVRFTNPGKLGDVKITRGTDLGGWPPVITTYQYSDTITRQGFGGDEAEAAAAPKTEYAYSVRMPGTIDESSVKPVGGRVEGEIVTWKLNAGEEKLEIAVSSAEPHWAPVILVVAILLVAGTWGTRYIVVRLRSKPRHI